MPDSNEVSEITIFGSSTKISNDAQVIFKIIHSNKKKKKRGKGGKQNEENIEINFDDLILTEIVFFFSRKTSKQSSPQPPQSTY
jgi:hypothetical protein